MRKFSFGETLTVTYPGNASYLAAFVVAKDSKGWPYLICYNTSLPRPNGIPQEPLTQGEVFICEGEPFKVDADTFALSTGRITGPERDAILRAA